MKSHHRQFGVYPTPPVVVDAMLEMTLGHMLQATTPERLCQEPLRILEPACGDGIFLVRAYRHLLDWHRTWYITQGSPCGVLETDANGRWHLTPAECQRILQASIYGIDIDPAAVVTTQQGLWQVLCQEAALYRHGQNALWDDTMSPLNLHSHIKVGNTIVGSAFQETENPYNPRKDNQQRTKNNRYHCPESHPPLPSTPFHWHSEFPEVAQAGGFDLVIGNPPYVDSECMQAYQPALRAYCQRYYQTAAGNWDIFCVFVERTIALCKPGGLTSLIVPNKLLSASYAAATRQVLLQQCRILALQDYSRVPVFPVAVYPIVYVAERLSGKSSQTSTQEPARIQYKQMQTTEKGTIVCANQSAIDHRDLLCPQHPWILTRATKSSTGTSQELSLATIRRFQTTLPTLAEVAEVSGAATVAEAYRMQPYIQNMSGRSLGEGLDVHSTPDCPVDLLPALLPADMLPIVNSGTIDRYRHLWGRKPMRYLGSSYLYPIIAAHHLTPRRQHQATQPKLILAGLSNVLECAIDYRGRLLAGKSTVLVYAAQNLFYLLALLNSRLLSTYYRQVFGGDCLQGGYLRIGLTQVKSLPIVPYDPGDPVHNQLASKAQQLWYRWQHPQTPTCQPLSVAQMEQAIDRSVCQLYNVNDAPYRRA